MAVLRIATYNLANGRYASHDFSKIAGDILAVAPDIVGLQEVDRFAQRSGGIDTVALLSDLTGFSHCAYTKALSLPGAGGRTGEYGTAILSRHVLEEADSLPLPSGAHEPRRVGYVRARIGGMSLALYNTHLSFECAQTRAEQFAFLAGRLSGETAYFLTGDFNTQNFSEFAVIRNAAPLNCDSRRIVTFPASDEAIDNILYSPEFVPLRAESAATGHSDHCLLWADFALAKDSAQNGGADARKFT